MLTSHLQNGVATVIFAGPEGLSRRLLSITGGFRADVCKQVYFGGSGDNNKGVTTVKFGRPGIRNFTCREDFSSSEALEKQISFEIACLVRLLQLQSCEKLLLQACFFREAGASSDCCSSRAARNCCFRPVSSEKQVPLEIAAAPELPETAASGLFLQRSRCLLRLLQLQSCEKLLLQASFFREAGAF